MLLRRRLPAMLECLRGDCVSVTSCIVTPFCVVAERGTEIVRGRAKSPALVFRFGLRHFRPQFGANADVSVSLARCAMVVG